MLTGGYAYFCEHGLFVGAASSRPTDDTAESSSWHASLSASTALHFVLHLAASVGSIDLKPPFLDGLITIGLASSGGVVHERLQRHHIRGTSAAPRPTYRAWV